MPSTVCTTLLPCPCAKQLRLEGLLTSRIERSANSAAAFAAIPISTSWSIWRSSSTRTCMLDVEVWVLLPQMRIFKVWSALGWPDGAIPTLQCFSESRMWHQSRMSSKLGRITVKWFFRCRDARAAREACKKNTPSELRHGKATVQKRLSRLTEARRAGNEAPTSLVLWQHCELPRAESALKGFPGSTPWH